jgi:4-hydroxy-4-methyl-2-oxoglutarate aldolase
MKKLLLLSACLLMYFPMSAQSDTGLSDEEILKLYDGLRVADVTDGLDVVGLRDLCIMDQKIVALWKDVENFRHRFCGIAVTARYVPTNRVIKNPMDPDEYKKWEGDWYSKISTEAYTSALKKGSVVVLDVQGDGDTGSVGSNNALFWTSKGAVGVVSNGGIRDTDELIKEKIPVYLDMDNRGRGIRPGRNELESFNKPVSVGGVLVNPGDIVVADGDGVVVVPRKYAADVAKQARAVLDSDKEGRRSLYKQLNRPLDNTVE